MHSIKPKTALISLSDKTGLEELINFLVSENVKMLSTGGTYKAIREITPEVIEVSDFTGFEEMMNGRVKNIMRDNFTLKITITVKTENIKIKSATIINSP